MCIFDLSRLRWGGFTSGSYEPMDKSSFQRLWAKIAALSRELLKPRVRPLRQPVIWPTNIATSTDKMENCWVWLGGWFQTYIVEGDIKNSSVWWTGRHTQRPQRCKRALVGWKIGWGVTIRASSRHLFEPSLRQVWVLFGLLCWIRHMYLIGV